MSANWRVISSKELNDLSRILNETKRKLEETQRLLVSWKYSWNYKDETDSDWIMFSEEHSSIMEAFFQTGAKSASFSIDDQHFEVNFVQMTLCTGSQTLSVRRIPTNQG